MSNLKYPQLCANIIKSLQEQGELLPNIEYMASKGIIRKTSNTGSYSVIFHGTAKECYSFLEGIQYLATANFTTNKNTNNND